MPEYDIGEIEKLIDGQLPWPRVQEIMKGAKDLDRFEKWVQILQGRVSWPEPIFLPLTPSLFIVQTENNDRVVKCKCGEGFAVLERELKYAKRDPAAEGGTGRLRLSYRLNNDETGAFTLLGVETSVGTTTLQFDATNKAGIKWRTVQFEIEPERARTSSLTADITNVATSIPVGNLALFPVGASVQRENEFPPNTGPSASSVSWYLTPATHTAQTAKGPRHQEKRRRELGPAARKCT